MREMKRESIALAGPDIGRDEWLMVRRQGLGGTEVAAIICDQAEPEMKVGCSVKSTYSIWAKKTGAVPEDSEVTGGVLARGHHLEGYVCHLYQQELPEGTVLFEHGLRQHPDRPIILATPDRMVDIKNTPLYGMDAKTRRFKKGWGEKGSSDVPLDVEVQMRAYMEVEDAPYWDVCTLFGLDDMRVYRIMRNRELGEQLLDIAQAWWDKHVVGGMPPDTDGSEATAKVLAKLHPRVTGTQLRPATPDEHDMHQELLAVRRQLRELDVREMALKNKLKERIGADPGIGGVATWKRSKDGATFNKKAFVAAHPDLYAQFTTPKPGSRRFLVSGEHK